MLPTPKNGKDCTKFEALHILQNIPYCSGKKVMTIDFMIKNKLVAVLKSIIFSELKKSKKFKGNIR